MKKFLIGILFLVPVVIVLAIAAAGSVIASSVAVMPSAIAVRDSNNEIVEEGSYLTLELTDTDAYIIIEVLPSIVQDSKVTFQFDEIENATGAVRIEQMGESNRYRLLPESAGEVRVIISAALDANIRRAITFWVKSDAITSVLLYDEAGKDVSTVRLTKPARLFADIYPIDALDGNLVSWRSDDESIVTVTKNGTLVPVSQGSTRVWFSAKDKAGTTHHKSVFVDAADALVRAETIYKSTLADAAWVKANVVLDAAAVVTALPDGFFVARGDDTATVRVLSCAVGEKGFLDELSTVYTQNGPYFLQAGLLESGAVEAGVRFSVSDGVAARVAGSEIIPLKAGTITVTAAFADGSQAQKTVFIKERPFTFELNLGSEDAARGIRRSRTWGVEWMEDDLSFRSTYQLHVKAEGPLYYDLLWQSDKPELASVDAETGLVTFYPAARGEEIKITASVLLNGNYVTRTARSFTFRVNEAEGLINVENETQLQNVVQRYPERGAALQADVYTVHEIRLIGAIYGNGFKISAEKRNLEDADAHTTLIRIIGDVPEAQNVPEIILDDIAVQGAASYEESSLKYQGVGVDSIQKPVSLRYLNIRFCNRGMDIRSNPEILIEGCILGDNYATSVFVGTRPESKDDTITFRNCVFKQSEGPAAFFSTHDNALNYSGMSITPKVRIEGFLEVYNWKRTDQMVGLLAAMEVENIDLTSISPTFTTEWLYKTMGEVMKDLFSQPKLARLIYMDSDGVPYVSTGLLFLGLIVQHDPGQIVFDRSMSVALQEIPLKGLNGALGTILDVANALTLEIGGFAIQNSLYFVGYDFGGNTPVHKPGEAIPQDEALYSRLTSFEPIEKKTEVTK